MSGNSSNTNPKSDPKPIFSLTENYQACLEILDEFVRDVEVAGENSCESDWPDLFRTYLKARQIVRDTDRAEEAHEPLIVEEPNDGNAGDAGADAEEARDRRRGLYGPEYRGEVF